MSTQSTTQGKYSDPVIPPTITVTMPNLFRDTGFKVSAIKALRTIGGMDLKEAKDFSERQGEQALTVVQRNFILFHSACEDLNRAGVKTSTPIVEILQDLRSLAKHALENGEDELANEIMQLILAEKLRRNLPV